MSLERLDSATVAGANGGPAPAPAAALGPEEGHTKYTQPQNNTFNEKAS